MPKRLSVSPLASTPVKRKAERKVAMALKKTFKATKKDVLPKLVDAYREVMDEHRPSTTKALGAESDHVLKELELDSWVKLAPVLGENTAAARKDAAKRALASLNITDTDLFDVVSEDAVAAAEARAADLVGMRWEGDKLVPNPSAEYAITETTRAGIKQLVETALTDGLTVKELAAKLQSSYQFSDLRAETIARTELANAHVDGTLAAWKKSGKVFGKRWLVGSEHTDDFGCDCSANEDEEVIGLDELFESGDDAPPAHPNCICVLITELRTEPDDAD